MQNMYKAVKNIICAFKMEEKRWSENNTIELKKKEVKYFEAPPYSSILAV